MSSAETSATPDRRPRVVIVGGGFGGLEAARGLRRADADVVVIDRNNYHTFQPLLYQVATAGLSPADISGPIRSILRSLRNVEVVMAEVQGVDAEKRLLQVHRRQIPYDYLVLATGAAHSYFGHGDWEKYAPGLKTLYDAITLRQDVLLAFEAAEAQDDLELQRELLTFVLVGGGPTGVEMAGAIAELSHKALAGDFRRIDPSHARIVLVEAEDRILPSFAPELSAAARRGLERLGVEVRTNERVEGIDASGVTVAGERILSRTVIWTAGVAASPAGRWLGVQTDRNGRIHVASDLSVPERPGVYAIGDTMRLEQDGKPLPGLAPVAMQQGRYVAKLIANRIAGRPAPPPFHYVDKGTLATVGRSFAVLQMGKLKEAGFIAWVIWLFVHITYLIGFRNRALVLFQWAWAYLTYQRGARIITAPAACEKVQPNVRAEPTDRAA